MKIKFNSDDELPLNKTKEIPTITIVVRAVFHENNEYYPRIFLDECLCKLKNLLYYDRIDSSEGTDVNKTSGSKESDICHYWYFLNYSFKFQPNVCNRCHDLLMISMNLSDIAVLNLQGPYYGCIISLEAINLMQNTDLTEKSRTL